MLDDVRREEGQQRDRLRDLQREYSMIETRYKSRIIEDLAGLYYESKEETSQRKVIQSRSGARQQDVTVDIHTQANKNVSKEVYKASREVSKASREASKASRERSERQMVRTKPVDQGSDSSLGTASPSQSPEAPGGTRRGLASLRVTRSKVIPKSRCWNRKVSQ